LFVGKIINL